MASPKHAEAPVPASARPAYDAVVALTDALCREHLNEEYRAWCQRLAGVLATEALRPGLPQSTPAGQAGGPGLAPVTYLVPTRATLKTLSPSPACWYFALRGNRRSDFIVRRRVASRKARRKGDVMRYALSFQVPPRLAWIHSALLYG
jgi:hypothetical protein